MDYISLGCRIRQQRKKKHLTQESLAELVGISPSFLGHIERGSRISSLETLMKLCTALEVTPNELLGDELAIEREALPDRVTIVPRELLHNIALLLKKQESP